VSSKEIRLDRNGLVALVDEADFELVSQFRWNASSRRNLSRYARTYVQEAGRKKMVLLHRLITGAPPEKAVDHINRDGLDNRRSNLRVCSHAENMRNRRGKPGKYRGVRQAGKKWSATIMVDGVSLYFGSFETPVEAAIAYDNAAIRHHGEFASLNFDPKRDWLLPYGTALRQMEAL
jgi:hypothetical protein